MERHASIPLKTAKIEAKYWLKALGMSAVDERLPDAWEDVEGGLLRDAATFGRRPSIASGDGIVYYAAGTGLVFAGGYATSYPYQATQRETTNWPWQVTVHLDHAHQFIHNGIPLTDLNVGDRDLRVSMKRHSHIQLTEDEYRAAIDRLSSTKQPHP